MRASPRTVVWAGALVCAGAALVACQGSERAGSNGAPEPSFQLLVAVDDWLSVPRDEDPFVTEPDVVPTCLGSGFFQEETYLEIDTGECSWVTVAANARFGVAAGQELRLLVSHYDLNAAEPAQAELRLWLGDCEAWSKSVPIPSPADFYTETLASPCSLQQGARVQFHLHNHGQNNWQLRELSVLR